MSELQLLEIRYEELAEQLRVKRLEYITLQDNLDYDPDTVIAKLNMVSAILDLTKTEITDVGKKIQEIRVKNASTKRSKGLLWFLKTSA